MGIRPCDKSISFRGYETPSAFKKEERFRGELQQRSPRFVRRQSARDERRLWVTFCQTTAYQLNGSVRPKSRLPLIGFE